ncbi:U1 small nuclear ribonucleoprotein C [Armadillidium nasatum]|uniref:U1 small nuclear ribonucleoprotein C n=1 Tax=Armadillidium nasatum TaxID=96803 RepID=A0A5N5TDY4_9CRUS|nr:U1 small nuclear ribonucleoprotein C [Armadillidium nasatum]
MPKYYCDYCDTYLTHDSPSVRKTHCQGRKHKENVKIYYQKWMEEQAQSLIDATKLTVNGWSSTSGPFALSWVSMWKSGNYVIFFRTSCNEDDCLKNVFIVSSIIFSPAAAFKAGKIPNKGVAIPPPGVPAPPMGPQGMPPQGPPRPGPPIGTMGPPGMGANMQGNMGMPPMGARAPMMGGPPMMGPQGPGMPPGMMAGGMRPPMGPMAPMMMGPGGMRPPMMAPPQMRP